MLLKIKGVKKKRKITVSTLAEEKGIQLHEPPSCVLSISTATGATTEPFSTFTQYFSRSTFLPCMLFARTNDFPQLYSSR
jgi:hypothetical protein